MIAVTGATGQLGHLVIQTLLKTVPASQIVAIVRTPSKASDLAARGVVVREGDYEKPATLAKAFAGIDKLLLISSSELTGGRFRQHQAAIDAAKGAGVKFIAYTSLLKADHSPLALAADHSATEKALKASGIPFTALRNGWYTENHTASISSALQYGVVLGAAGDARFASAARADYADAAAAVLTQDGHAGKIYELAGDTSYTLADFAAELGRQVGRTIGFNNLPETDFKGVLVGAGLPEPLAELLAGSDTGAAKGGLDDTSHTLSRLIDRPTTPLATTIAAALKG